MGISDVGGYGLSLGHAWHVAPMGVATTTDTTDSVRTSFGRPQNLYGMSVQVLAEKKTFFI